MMKYVFYIPGILAFILSALSALAQNYPPSHDPSTMMQNVDGRYWIFTTGEGIWTMSSDNADFTDWRPEPVPFPNGTFPSWVVNYVKGFEGHFWAPDIIKIGNTYYLYYSCAGEGAPAAIGLTTATDLRGPWRDQGMVVAGNNAIDPALLMDDDGRLWMSWGNWQSGIDIVELDLNTGKRISGSRIINLINDNVEGPGLAKNEGYYYLFFQRGLCCQGLQSGYHIVVRRSTNITGPYTDERVFLSNRSGREHGPGHFGYNYGRLTYHFYDVNNNGAAKLRVRTDYRYQDGWPVVGNLITSVSIGRENAFHIYPVPTKGMLYLTVKEEVDWVLMDGLYQIIQEGKSLELDLSEVENGLYFLKINEQVFKVVKE